MTAVVINTKLRLTSKEKTPSVWLEGQKLAKGGIETGQVLYAHFDKSSRRVVASKSGDADLNDVKAFTVSRRRRNGKEHPLIELRAEELASLFEGVEVLRVAIQNGKITIRAHSQQAKVKSRLDRLFEKVLEGKKLDVGSIFHGGGVLDRALHNGFAMSGLQSAIKVAVEIEGKYLDSSLANNPMLWDKDSIAIESPLESVELASAPLLDCVFAGIPCVGASLSGRAKGKLSCAEEHSSAGALFVYFLNFVLATQPAIVVFENVPPYQKTASYMVIESVLLTAGYDIHSTVLNGNTFGALENRDRLVCVATTKGLDFDFDRIEPVRVKEKTLSEILDYYPQDSDKWKTYSYLAEKEQRDMANGKGFKRQLLDGTNDSCGTIGRGYNKARSTEPFVISPFGDGMSRLFSPLEHARVKGIPEDLINGVSDTTAHEILGQSVIYPAFQAVGNCIATQVREAVSMQHVAAA
ncbi:DNA cytosine methyltransferase (plasmid) [Maricurvus nonylphenolicus]|uniref:DNA cytosine methyltransferase n=1 Tax=Maricurvus nonylphenolicus TaxID=1008307 RepID=UPI0036F3F308